MRRIFEVLAVACVVFSGGLRAQEFDRSIIPAYFTDAPPTLDGVISPGEWDAAGTPITVLPDSPNAQLANDIGEDVYGGPDDLSFQFRAMWSGPDTVYFLYQVTDDIAMSEDPTNLWERDQVETFLDGNDLDGNDDSESFHWWASDEPFGKFGVSRNGTFEGNGGNMSTEPMDLGESARAVGAATETGNNADYVVELAVSLETMFELGIFDGTETGDAGAIVPNSTSVKMTVAVSDDDNFDTGSTERSHTLTYFREQDGVAGNWDQSSFFADLFFLSEFSGGDIIKGDLNADGAVDQADYEILLANFRRKGASFTDGDLDFDREVNLRDFIEFAGIFAAQDQAAVPEPEAWLLSCLGFVAFASIATRHRSKSKHSKN